MSRSKLHFKRCGNYLRINNQITFPTTFSEEVEEIHWRLRYGTPTKTDLFFASDVMSAYEALILKTQKERNYICENIKAAESIK